MYLIPLAIAAITLGFLRFLGRLYNYWPEKGVKQRRQTYLFGDYARVVFRKETFFDLFKNLYGAFPKERYVGMYQMMTPSLVLRDPELIKQVTVKDFDHFVDHSTVLPPDVDEFLSRNLAFLKGNRWRDIRSKMSPTFTASKMKTVFNFVSDCAQDFNRNFLDSASEGVVSLDMKDTCARFTNDVIAAVAFGVKCDSLRERDNDFYRMGIKATSFTDLWLNLRIFAYILLPKLCRLFKMSIFYKDVGEFFTRVVKDAITSRREKGIIRQDVLHLLLEAKKERQTREANDGKLMKREIRDIDITAQAMIFFFAGFESVSTLLCFMGYELAANPDVQRKLQAEIDATMEECDGILTYEALLKMKYLDMVVSETLRRWPVVAGTDRVCTKPYTIQPVRPSEKPIGLNEGDVVVIPVIGLHHDPKYFPEPERFDPERFNDENKNAIEPYAYLPFGVGPRNCLGSRFALMETKTIFFHLLSKYDLVATEKTQIPLKLSKKSSFNLMSENGIWVGLKLRDVAK